MKKNEIIKDDEVGALFIPAGVLMGLGFGFLFGNVPAGMFIGLGFGFLLFAITNVALNKKYNKK